MPPVLEPYPQAPADRDRWVLSRRGPKSPVDPRRPYAFLVEEERAASGDSVPVATLFLTNRECPWRCVYCNLWRHTLDEPTPPGAIPTQIDFALGILASAAPRHLKLYNAGSFFDPLAVPPVDWPAIAERSRRFEHLVVECHPTWVNERVVRFRDSLGPKTTFEVAMGLETANPETLERLHKRLTLDDFAQAADLLRRHGIALRAFVLVKPPFLTDEAEARVWARRSIDFAQRHGASPVVLIPTRGGNGALEELARLGQLAPPRLATVEAALDYGVGLRAGRVFADLWDLERLASCPHCQAERRRRLERINRYQEVLPAPVCPHCAVVSAHDAGGPTA